MIAPESLEKTPEQGAEFVDAEEFKFVGYRQPKESGVWFVIKKHKFRFAISSLLVVTIVLVSSILVVSRSGQQQTESKVASQSQYAQQPEVSSIDQSTEPVANNPNDVSKREYSLQQSEPYIELVSKSGDVWLTRSELSWGEQTSWGDWLFFAANRSATVDMRSTVESFTIGIEAFSLKAKQFLPVAEIKPGVLPGVKLQMRTDGTYLYIEISGTSGLGSTHRCSLDEQKACSDMKVFYSGGGTVTQVNDSSAIVVDRSSEAASGTVVVRNLNLTNQETTDIIQLQKNGTVSNVLAAVAADNLLWIAETDASVITQLYAVNMSGTRAFVLPAQSFPIAGVQLATASSLKVQEIMIHNTAQSVAFNLETKQFGAVKSYNGSIVDDSPKTEIRKIIELTTRLGLPDDYVLRTAQ